MVVITKTRLISFYELETIAREPLLKWYQITLLCDWQDFHDVKETFNSVDSIGNDRYVFNVAGNKYRIVAMIHFSTRTVYIRFIGTHKQYHKINCKII
jgi:mRNA interferase HigB